MSKQIQFAKKHAIAVILDAGLYPHELFDKRGITPNKIVKLLGIRYEDGRYVKGVAIERAILHWHNTGSLTFYGKPPPIDETKTRAIRDARLLRVGANLVARNARAAMKKKPLESDAFYSSKEWKELRYMMLRLSEGACNCCGANHKMHGAILHVDHIKPRSTYPMLALSLDNLQVLCEDCNIGKSNTDETDFRSDILKQAIQAIISPKRNPL